MTVARNIHIVTVTEKKEAVKMIPSKTKTPVSKLAVNSVPVRLTVDSGVRLTILNWSDWLKIQHTGAKPVSTNRSFVPYRMDSKMLIYARAKLTMQAKRGAVMQTNVYIMEDSQAESLLGRDDGIRLDLIDVNDDVEESHHPIDTPVTKDIS